MKKLLVLGFMMLAGYGASAGTSVNWQFSWGMYPNGAASLTAGLPAGVAQTQNVLWQLILSSSTAHIVDPLNPLGGYTSGGDVVYNSRITPLGGDATFDNQLFNSASISAFESNAVPVGNFYIRVFQDATPASGEWYYNSPVLAAVDINILDPLRIPQLLDGNTDGANKGDALNLQIIPEPGTAALALLGMGLVGYRRLRKA